MRQWELGRWGLNGNWCIGADTTASSYSSEFTHANAGRVCHLQCSGNLLPSFHLALLMPLTPAHHSLVQLRMVLVCIYFFMLGGMRAIRWLCASRSFDSSVQDMLPCSRLCLLLPCQLS